MRDIFWTMGKYDIVSIVEADSEEALIAFNLALASAGNVRSHSMRAFSAAEMDKALAKMP